MTGVTLLRVWYSMQYRCNNPKREDYERYGGRDITVCLEWKNYRSFWEWAQANGFKEGLELDRIDNNKGYSPDNCHFVTRKVNNNNKRNNRRFTAFGETKNISQWVDDPRCVVNYDILRSRLIRWPVKYTERAITQPSSRSTSEKNHV